MAQPSRLTILGIPFEASTSFLKGTKEGPQAILNALKANENLSFNSKIICDPGETDPLAMESATYEAALDTLKAGDFPLGLGGEHTVSLGLIRAAKGVSKIGVVQLDAHSDLREQYEGNRWSHACVMRRANEMGCPVLGIGIRAMCKEEADFASSKDDVNLVGGRQAAFSTDWYRLLDNLPSHIYLTVDMDAFDPTEVPAVGTPEPG